MFRQKIYTVYRGVTYELYNLGSSSRHQNKFIAFNDEAMRHPRQQNCLPTLHGYSGSGLRKEIRGINICTSFATRCKCQIAFFNQSDSIRNKECTRRSIVHLIEPRFTTLTIRSVSVHLPQQSFLHRSSDSTPTGVIIGSMDVYGNNLVMM
jgi:hypothetical protein